MGRFFLAAVAGSGTRTDPYRPDVTAATFAAQIPTDGAGAPTTDALVYVADDQNVVADGTTVVAFPPINLGATLGSALDVTQRGTLASQIQAKRGVTVTMGANRTLRDVLNETGKAADPAFNVDRVWAA